MANTAQIKAVITADDKASATLKSFGDNVNAGAKKAAIALGAAGVALTVFAKNATDFTVDYVKGAKLLARETGNTVEESSRLMHVTNRLGVSVEEASVSFGIFSKNIKKSTEASEETVKAQKEVQEQIESTQFEIKTVNRELDENSKEMKKNGDKSGELAHKQEGLTLKLKGLNSELEDLNKQLTETKAPFDKIGVATKNADGTMRTFNQILLDTADKFKAMPDGIEKTALSMELFGRSGKEMIKVLNLGSVGIAQLEEQADKLGLTLTATNVDSISKYIESQKNLKDSTDALKIAVGETTTPVLTAFQNKINEVVTSLLNTDGAVRATTVGFLAFGGPVLGGAAALLGFAANLGQVLVTAKELNAFLIGFGGFAVIAAAAIAAGIAIVYAGNQAKAAWDNTAAAVRKATDSNDAVLRRLQDLVRNGTPEQQQRARATLKGLSEGGSWATGGFTGRGGANEVAGMVHKGEYVLPQSMVNQSTGQPKAVAGNVSLNVNVGMYAGTEMEKRKMAESLMRALQDLAVSKNTSVGKMMGL